jgi:HPt (histidine-containing phosphotransfer) domain-containing protein
LASFRDQFNEKLQELSDDLIDDPNDVRKLAHALKSMSANMGAKRLALEFSNAELAARKGTRYSKGDLISFAKRELKLYEEHVDSYRHKER